MVTSINGNNITWRNYTDNKLYTDKHINLERIMRRGGKTRKNKKNNGGLFVGKTHEEGGIPIRIMPRGEIAEVEHNEYLINAKTVERVGTKFLDKLNSTATPYYPASSGFRPGELGPVSKYRSGGRIMRNGGLIVEKGQNHTRKIPKNEIKRAINSGYVSETKDKKLIFNKKRISNRFAKR